MTLNKKYSIFLKINTYYHTKNVRQLFTKSLKTLRAQVDATGLGRLRKIGKMKRNIFLVCGDTKV